MLLVNGEKMSKSLGNFTTLRDALARAPGEAIRLLLLRTHYRSTPDFTDAALAEATTRAGPVLSRAGTLPGCWTMRTCRRR